MGLIKRFARDRAALLGACLLGLLVCAIILRYPLDATAHAEIRRQLDERDAAELPPSPPPEPHVAPLAVPKPAE